jgi:hypothetical protein
MPRGLLSILLALPLAALGQKAPVAVPVPHDPLELVTGSAEPLEGPERDAANQLLVRAREVYLPRGAGAPVAIRYTFTVSSGGTTEHDGKWEVEEVSSPPANRRWTAKASDGYQITQISADAMAFGEGTVTSIPLRFHEARAMLFDPIAIVAQRRADAAYNGKKVTCLLNGAVETVPTVSGRRWDEAETCIDAETGLMVTNSAVPGRYTLYDYTDASKVGKFVLPSKITVTEAGKVVNEIHVESLAEIPEPDKELFTATKEMKWGVTMVAQQKVFVNGEKSFPPAGAIQPVVVYGLLAPSGDLLEAHSLQPDDPNSKAALDHVKTMKYFGPSVGAEHSQHFVFVYVKFAAPR